MTAFNKAACRICVDTYYSCQHSVTCLSCLSHAHGTWSSWGGMCNFFGSVSLQQKFHPSITAWLQLSFIWQAKENISLRPEDGPTLKKRGDPFWLLLFMFFSLPSPSLLYVNWASQEDSVSPEILTLVLRPSFVLFSRAFSFLCLLAAANLDSYFLF